MRSKIEELTGESLLVSLLMIPGYLLGAVFLVAVCSGPVLLFAVILLGLAE
jgi:hypothetical protein